jgi:hypothetical protein
MASKDFKVKVRLEGDASGATKAIKKTEGGFKRLGTSLRTAAFAITGALASMLGAYKALEAAGERLGQKRSLERTLTAQGIAIDEFVGKLKSLANNQIATSDLVLASNRALALGISSDDLPGLLEAATKASVSLGISATQAFNDITTGVGRASPLILDNLGIVVDAVRVYKDYAANIGLSAEALTKQQKTAALSAAVMKNAAKGAEDFATAQSRVTVALTTSKAALKEWWEQTIDSIARNEELADSINETADAVSDFATGIGVLTDAIKGTEEAEKNWIQRLIASKTYIALNTAGLSFAIRAIRELGDTKKLLAETEKEALENIRKLTERRREQADAIWGTTKATDALVQAQEDAAARTARIESALNDEASALAKLAAALGEVTQIELEKELHDITEALEEARNSTDANSDAFVRYERIAGEKIDRLNLRIRGLVNGIGDIGEVTDEAGDAIEDFGEKSDTAGDQVDDLGDSIDEAKTSTDDLRVGMEAAERSIARTGAQAIRTAAQFDALRKSAGDAAAVAAALEGGGRLTQGGTRVRFATGGSRLTNTTGTGSNSYSLSQFGTGGNHTVDKDGTLRPA